MTEREVKIEAKQQVYSKWRRALKLGCCEEWKKFETFYRWAMKTGFVYGAVLKRHNNNKPYSPRNCYWQDGEKTNKSFSAMDFCSLWNKTVNRIREHYGMESFAIESAEQGGMV